MNKLNCLSKKKKGPSANTSNAESNVKQSDAFPKSKAVTKKLNNPSSTFTVNPDDQLKVLHNQNIKLKDMLLIVV